jgi:hypothetical protein
MGFVGLMLMVGPILGCSSNGSVTDLTQIISPVPTVVAPTPTPTPVCNSALVNSFGGGAGTQSSPYTICNVEQWKSWALSGANLDKYISIESNLDFSTLTGAVKLATGATHFTGSIDGNGKTISGLNLSGLTADYALILNAANGATIKNLNFSNITIGVTSGRASLLVLNQTSGRLTIDNLNLTNVKLNLPDSAENIGGLVGLATDISVSNLKISGLEINMAGGTWLSQIGGLVGYVQALTSAVFQDIVIDGLKLTQADTNTGSGSQGGLLGRFTGDSLLVKNVSVNSPDCNFLVQLFPQQHFNWG